MGVEGSGGGGGRSEEEMTLGLINANPVVHAKKERVARAEDSHADDAVDALDVFGILSPMMLSSHLISWKLMEVFLFLKKKGKFEKVFGLSS